jgi:hemoglobin
MASLDSHDQTLYQRLGGYDAICAATDDLLGRLQGDSRLKDFWKGASADNRRKARQLIVEYMVEAAGGPAYYVGRDMKRAHEGMRIDDEDWAVFMRHAAATLDNFGVAQRERDEVLGFFQSLRKDVVDGWVLLILALSVALRPHLVAECHRARSPTGAGGPGCNRTRPQD